MSPRHPSGNGLACGKRILNHKVTELPVEGKFRNTIWHTADFAQAKKGTRSLLLICKQSTILDVLNSGRRHTHEMLHTFSTKKNKKAEIFEMRYSKRTPINRSSHFGSGKAW
ncbi:hypothetical protein AVEN_197811-1 [Araneus ventricosus]|uniref:Uncharacterized protein n=1 Tax=Araneus ventricosus TaxID=182803 RepID=A0A4Y2NM99_ARAVE|nr:hypothetical protein AVEN_197811-1 [Araneus ventricosus]